VKRKKRKEANKLLMQVLVADDSQTIRKIVELCLSECAIEVVGAANGAEAVERMKRSMPALVLADSVMPEIDGYQLCERIKNGEFGAVVPVVVLADVFEPLDVARLSSCGADGHITKPFDAKTLQLVISDQLGIEAPASAHRAAPAPPASYAAPGQAPSANGAGRTQDMVLAGGEFPAGPLSNVDAQAVAQQLVKLMSSDVIREIAWDVIPEMSELLIREQLQKQEVAAEK
jgi:CheY-like chemotaxis protein